MFDGDETIGKALDKLDLHNLDGVIPGMKTTLYPHQVMGVAWMVEKEGSRYSGGCLGDEMGLGKVRSPASTLDQFLIVSFRRSRCRLFSLYAFQN
jgi:SNF2 family DNA or RNA helicase